MDIGRQVGCIGIFAPSSVSHASQRPRLLGNLFGQFGEDEGPRCSCGYLEDYLVVARCSSLVFAFTAWDVSKQVVDLVTESLGGDDVLTLEGGHASKYFEVCNNGVCGFRAE